MQGGYETTAAIMRQILTLRGEELLAGVLEITDEVIQPMSPNFARDTVEILRVRFGDEHSPSSVKSTIKVTLPTFLGLTFKPYEARGPQPRMGRVAELETRVATLEKQMQALLPQLT